MEDDENSTKENRAGVGSSEREFSNVHMFVY
jgi:hypothetical protein